MYVPDHFNETREEVLHEFIRANPLGLLVTVTDAGPEANHIPFYLTPNQGGHGSLLGDVSRSNPAWRTADNGSPSLVVFQGPSSYISPSWYPTKDESGKVVPTWNHVAVHAHGVLKIHDDTEWLKRQVDQMTLKMESSREAPWSVSDAPSEYIERMLRGIVGIEIVIERLVGKWKVSQNQADINAFGAAESLESTEDPAALEMAALIRASRS